MSRLKQLSRDSLIYGFGEILAKGTSFLLLPIYTRIFSPADYGTIEMLTVLSSFLTAFLVMGMDSAQSFFFFKEKKMGKIAQRQLVSAILQWRLIWGTGIVTLATICSPLLNYWLFDSMLSWQYFAAAFAAALFSTVMSQSIEIFRLLYRPWAYVLVAMFGSIFTAAIILTLVMSFRQGIWGYFSGATIGSAVTAIFGWFLIRDYIEFSRLHTQWWPRLLRFGLPLLPAGLGFYVMSTTDRWFIQHHFGADELGLYAVGAKFALLLTVVIEAFRKAWWPIAMDAMHSEDGPETYRMIARLYVGIGVIGVVILGFISPWLVKWVVGPQFYSSWPIIGVLAWQSLFYGVFLVVSAGIWKTEKTYLNMYLMIMAGVVNVILNAFLVPKYGGMGAAIATALTFFIWIVVSAIVSERLWQVRFPFTIMAIQIGIGVLTVFWLTTQHEDINILIQLSVITAVIILLLFSSFDEITRKTIHTKVISK